MKRNLKRLFTKQFILKRKDLNDDCIRYDVIKVIGEQLKSAGVRVTLDNLYHMKTDKESLILLNKFKEKYKHYLKDKWLIDLLIELQNESINNLGKFVMTKEIWEAILHKTNK